MKINKTETTTQAFCRACKKGVELPHQCPEGELVVIPPYRGGGM